MCPLPMTHPLVDDEEQLDRSAEHLVVAGELSEPAVAVGPGYPKKSVQVLTQFVATRPIRLPEIRGIHRPLRTLVSAFRGVDSPGELGHGGTFGPGHGDDFPGLEIAARRSPTRGVEDLAHELFRQRLR